MSLAFELPMANLALPILVLTLATGCYHFSFEQSGTRDRPADQLVTHEVRVPTYLNGFVGTGEVDTSRYCDEPVRTELRVTATDVLLSIATVLIYTPHTLYVTCPVDQDAASADDLRR